MGNIEQLFIRHGHSEANVGTPRLDSGDPDLTAVGEVQSAHLGSFLAQQALEVIVVTPKLRGTRTIDIASYGLGVPVVVDDRLVEVGWGEASGLPIKEAFPPEVDQRARREGYQFQLAPGAETPQESHDRVHDLACQYRSSAAAFLCHSWLIRNYLAVQAGRTRDDMRGHKVANTEVLSYIPGSRRAARSLYVPQLLPSR